MLHFCLIGANHCFKLFALGLSLYLWLLWPGLWLIMVFAHCDRLLVIFWDSWGLSAYWAGHSFLRFTHYWLLAQVYLGQAFCLGLHYLFWLVVSLLDYGVCPALSCNSGSLLVCFDLEELPLLLYMWGSPNFSRVSTFWVKCAKMCPLYRVQNYFCFWLIALDLCQGYWFEYRSLFILVQSGLCLG